MEQRVSQDPRLIAIFLAACLLHALLLAIPVVRQAVVETESSPALNIRLQAPRPEPKPPEPEPRVVETPPPVPVQPEQLPEPTIVESPPVQIRPAPAPDINASRILLELEEKRRSDPLAAMPENDQPRPDFYIRNRQVLDDVINEPSLQLPFEDSRVYLMHTYEPGMSGSVERFFDRVTVPFGFTTKNNTRIQCAWVLVLAGCSWGDASLFKAREKVRKRK